jgi:hypothetical protein
MVANAPLRDDEGSVLPALVVAVLGLVAFTVFVMVPMGSVADERAKARTAADAGALAAASRVKLNLEQLYPELVDRPAPPLSRADVVNRVFQGSCEAARSYAVRNGAASSVQCLRSGMWEFTVSVRMAQPVEDSSVHATATAAARLDAPGLRVGADGLCVELPDGDELCLPRPEPPAPATPPPTPTPTPEPEPPPLPALDVVLVE